MEQVAAIAIMGFGIAKELEDLFLVVGNETIIYIGQNDLKKVNNSNPFLTVNRRSVICNIFYYPVQSNQIHGPNWAIHKIK